MPLSEEHLLRYSRQLVLPGFGEQTQERLRASRVLVAGCGGLGSAAAFYLAAAGIGTLGLADSDTVDLSNLQRQILHTTHDLGRPKTDSAAEKLKRLDPSLLILTFPLRLTPDNLHPILRDFDLVVDATDTFESKFSLNDACTDAAKPLVHAGLLGYQGQVMSVLPGHACYRCLFPEPPPPGAVPSCAQAGVLGAVAGTLGCIQALETVKILSGIGEPLLDRLLVFDGLTSTSRIVPVRRRPGCRCATAGPTPP